MNAIHHHPHLTGVPETLLWTLHGRAQAALDPMSSLDDPAAVRVYQQIAYDFMRFGPPDVAHGLTVQQNDLAVERWLAQRQAGGVEGMVVELGVGLETRHLRCGDHTSWWVCVDVPCVMSLRDRLLPPTRRCAHIACSALGTKWMDLIPDDGPVCIIAQGLLMYFEPYEVQSLVAELFQRFPLLTLIFDAVPSWLSQKTLRGWLVGEGYAVPSMPWGIDPEAVEATLRAWAPEVASVTRVDAAVMGNTPGPCVRALQRLPGFKRHAASVVVARSAPR
ncbi:MAG: hypothetical protein MK101_12630 [Phycisphaerales bacterium]|nr:hypothetical protein [Phycisphaerales bacterium]